HLWYPPRKDQPAYIVPALINIGDGPSGLVYYPGTGLPQRYQGHFFLCDFRGTPSNSGIRSFRTEPHGAGFSVINSEQFAWGVLATDVDFGPDGGLYILDWVEGWGKTGKGRIHRLFDPAHQNSSLVRDIQTLLASDWKSKTVAELVPLLGHVDRRIRMEAQTTLVHHREQATAVASILQFLADSPNETAQVFACWTLGQMLRRTPSVEAADRLRKLVLGNQTRLVIAILKSLSDSKPAFTLKGEEYAALLQHQNSAVKAQAALCMAAHPTEGLFVPICELLQQATEDPWLRHAGIMALASLLQKDPSYWEKIRGLAPAVRLAGVVAARKLKLEAALVSYLGDKDRTIQMESIRALHDEPGYPEGKRAIALLDINREYSEPIQLRLLHAQYLSGTAEAAGKLAAFVSEGNRSVTLRGEALKMLGNWAKPSGRDWVIGLWRPIAPRSADPAKKAVLSAFADWKTLPAPILTEAIRAVEKLQLAVLGSSVLELARNASSSLEVRLAAMQAATSLGGEGVEEVARGWLSSSEPKERLAARTTLVKLRPDKAVGLLQQILEQGSVQEQQTALILLRQLENAEADVVLERLLRSFAAGLLAPELQVELQEAVQVRGHTHWKKLWQEGIGQLGKAGPYAQHRPALLGGDASEG
ncbi:MAG TPA: hypothetical protein PKA06_05075, partial [Gemmatales bacterium]|nr:hypothetical protein [Gemmatales bacterium]